MVKSRKSFSLILALALSLILVSAALAHSVTPYSIEEGIGMYQEGDAEATPGVEEPAAETTPAVEEPAAETTPAVEEPGAQATPGVEDPQQGAQPGAQPAPGTLPQTGGVVTPWTTITLVVIGGLILASGLGLALARRSR